MLPEISIIGPGPELVWSLAKPVAGLGKLRGSDVDFRTGRLNGTVHHPCAIAGAVPECVLSDRIVILVGGADQTRSGDRGLPVRRREAGGREQPEDDPHLA